MRNKASGSMQRCFTTAQGEKDTETLTFCFSYRHERLLAMESAASMLHYSAGRKGYEDMKSKWEDLNLCLFCCVWDQSGLTNDNRSLKGFWTSRMSLMKKKITEIVHYVLLRGNKYTNWYQSIGELQENWERSYHAPHINQVCLWGPRSIPMYSYFSTLKKYIFMWFHQWLDSLEYKVDL